MSSIVLDREKKNGERLRKKTSETADRENERMSRSVHPRMLSWSLPPAGQTRSDVTIDLNHVFIPLSLELVRVDEDSTHVYSLYNSMRRINLPLGGIVRGVFWGVKGCTVWIILQRISENIFTRLHA